MKKDIERLHEKFKKGFGKSQDELISRARDLPPVAGRIIWARQIEGQLSAYMRRVEDVLGKGEINNDRAVTKYFRRISDALKRLS